MNLRKKGTKNCLIMLMISMLLLSLMACGGEDKDKNQNQNQNQKTIDVIKNMDTSSIVYDGDVVNFNVDNGNGEAIRFQGRGIEVSSEGLVIKKDALLFSLDYLGGVSQYRFQVTGTGNLLSGPVYADRDSVEKMQDLYPLLMCVVMAGDKELQLYEPQCGFAALEIDNTGNEDLVISELTISYSGKEKQVLYSELNSDAPEMSLFALYPVDWEGDGFAGNADYVDVTEPGVIPEDVNVWEYGDGEVMDILEYIDYSSVVQDGVFTNFNVVDKNGKTIRFQGMGVNVSKDEFILQPNAKLFSLDYMGKIVRVGVKSEQENMRANVPVVYSDKTGVDSMQQLKVYRCGEIEYCDDQGTSLEAFESGFFGLMNPSNNFECVKIDGILVKYIPDSPHVPYSQMDKDSEDYRIRETGHIRWDVPMTLRPVADEYTYLEYLLTQPETLQSDIIAGIDMSTVNTVGNTVYFNSTMSDGTVVRFEAKDIELTEQGIRICSTSSIISLDAIGKIYGYNGYVADCTQTEYSIDTSLVCGFGYTYSKDLTSVDSAKEIHTYGATVQWVTVMDGEHWASVFNLQPNFINVSGNSYATEEFLLSKLIVAYNPSEKTTDICEAGFDFTMTHTYMTGERYLYQIEESASIETNDFLFYLVLRPDTPTSYMEESAGSIYFVPKEFYDVGDLRDAEGNVLDKKNAIVTEGTTIDVTVGDYSLTAPLVFVERYEGAQTMNDLIPYNFPEALGEYNVLVVPIAWSDQKENATQEKYEEYCEYLGRVQDINGNVTDYTDYDDTEYALSEYFDKASYGKFSVSSFMTEWYYSDRSFAECERMGTDVTFAQGILEWVKETYPDIDWSRFDQDANGYVDSMILINAGELSMDGYSRSSYAGALQQFSTYYGEYAGTPENPNTISYVNLNDHFFDGEGAKVLIHEFSHNLGLIDYYDVTDSGINAVGGFDMQSSNAGDWNMYSKMAVGWTEPLVVSGLESGEWVEYTIGSSALTGDVIVIPAAGATYDGPFCEYVMIDLLTADGVNEYDANMGPFDLKDVNGVRISHVNANMEKRTMEVDSITHPGESSVYDIGTIHVANNYKKDGMGQYNIEVIQSGKKNTFTTVGEYENGLSKKDLFYAGDKFSVEEYDEFFYEGLMDDGREFGYTVEIISVGEDANGLPTATIRVTAE